MQDHTISFRNAFRGLVDAVKTQYNFRIHTVLAIMAITLGLYLGLSTVEGAILSLTIGFVFVAELFNTAVEYTCNAITYDRRPEIGLAKDISASAVLFSAMIAVVVGMFIFLPKII